MCSLIHHNQDPCSTYKPCLAISTTATPPNYCCDYRNCKKELVGPCFCSEMGQRAGLSLESSDMYQCCSWRRFGRLTMTQKPRLSLGIKTHSHGLQIMKTHVPMQLKEANWRCCNGHEAKAIPGIRDMCSFAPKRNKLVYQWLWSMCYYNIKFTVSGDKHSLKATVWQKIVLFLLFNNCSIIILMTFYNGGFLIAHWCQIFYFYCNIFFYFLCKPLYKNLHLWYI